MQTKDIPLHDIKPLIEIQEYSLYYFIAVVVMVSVIVVALIYLGYKYIQKRNSFNVRAEYKKILEELNYDEPKRVAYEVTLYGALFENDSEHHKETYTRLVEELEAYKYKKDVESLSEETKQSINNYLGMLDV